MIFAYLEWPDAAALIATMVFALQLFVVILRYGRTGSPDRRED